MTQRIRVRRDSPEAQDELRRCAIDAALELFATRGLDAVSMRGVAQACGVTPMALYRYFKGKSELLLALWEHVLTELVAALEAAGRGHASAGARLRADVDAFIAYWEARPEHFRLVYMSSGSAVMTGDPSITGAPVYRRLLDGGLRLTEDYAAEIGAPAERCALALDLRYAMLVGYLHSRLVNKRFPWSDLGALRMAVIDAVMLSVAGCLHGDGRAQPGRPLSLESPGPCE